MKYAETQKYPDVSNQKMIIGGLQGTGKTYYSKKLVNFHGYRVLVYAKHRHDYISEPENWFIYIPKDFYEEIEDFIGYAIELGKKKQIDGVLIDEFDLIYRNNSDLKRNMNDLILNHRHYNLFMIGVTRRPQDIPQKVLESSKYKVFFAIEGDNVIKKLNASSMGRLGDKVGGLRINDRKAWIKEVGYSAYMIDMNETAQPEPEKVEPEKVEPDVSEKVEE